MDNLINIEIYELIKKHRPNCKTKPNLDDITDVVINKLQLSKSCKSKVKEDIEELFNEYKTIQKNNYKIHNAYRKINEKVAIKKSSYYEFGLICSLR